jgi:hypothetical protein
LTTEGKKMRMRRIYRAGSIAVVLLVSACASTAPKADFSQDLASHYKIDADDRPEVQVDAAAGVEVLELDKQRISQVIASKLEQRRLQVVANGDPKECVVRVTLTRYQRGNAFARAMLAGLGQIHIDATVKVYAKANDQKIADFVVAKTFAWGGKLIACFEHYLALETKSISRAIAEQRMLEKLSRSLTEDIAPLLPTGIHFNDEDALRAFERVWKDLISRIQGDDWKLTEKVIGEIRGTKYGNLLK